MDIIEWYVGFHPRHSLAEAIRERRWSMFGHVEAWGYTRDGTWVFFDPAMHGTTVHVTHHADEVDNLMGRRFELCWSILKLPHPDTRIRNPLHPPMNCAAQVAHLLGLRAYTPWGLHRILRQLGAQERIK